MALRGVPGRELRLDRRLVSAGATTLATGARKRTETGRQDTSRRSFLVARVAMLVACGLVAGSLLGACGGDDGDGQENGQSEDELDVSGEQVFVDTGCGRCHTLQAAGTQGSIGPNLDETSEGQSAEEIRTSIVNPDAEITAGYSAGVMPNDYEQQLSNGELSAVSQFIADRAGS